MKRWLCVAAAIGVLVGFSVDAQRAGGGGAGGSRNDWFDSQLTDPNLWRAHSLRPNPATNCAGTASAGTCGAYWKDQLAYKNLGGYQVANATSDFNTLQVTYDYNCWHGGRCTDADGRRQDAAKITMPQFLRRERTAALASEISSSQTTLTLAEIRNRGHFCADDNSHKIRIDSEIMAIGPCADVDATANTIKVTRGVLGTRAVAHGAGAEIHVNNNALINFVSLPVKLDEGYSYFAAIDIYFTDTFGGLENYKAFQWVSGRYNSANFDTWLETNTAFDGAGKSGYRQGGPNCNVMVPAMRSYQVNGPGSATWTSSEQSDPGAYGPSYGAKQLNYILPRAATPTAVCHRWGRYIWEIVAKANDYDYVNQWWCDEQNDCVETHHRFPTSILVNGPEPNTIPFFVLEFDTSTSPLVGSAPYPDRVLYVSNLIIKRSSNLSFDWSRDRVRPAPGN